VPGAPTNPGTGLTKNGNLKTKQISSGHRGAMGKKIISRYFVLEMFNVGISMQVGLSLLFPRI